MERYSDVKATVSAAIGAALALMAGAASANDFEPALRTLATGQIRSITTDATVIEAIKAQNVKHATLDAATIDKLDKQWRAEAKAGGKGPLIDSVLSSALSRHLAKVQADSDGLFLEIFVMDDKGLNVGQSAITTDYWQGDEPKWQKTFSVGPDAVLIDDVDFDESSKAFVSQVSTTIVDPATKQPIGAVTIGVNVEKLP